MLVSKLLTTLSRLAKENKLKEPYIVGGIPRDKAFGEPGTIKDIDITTGNKDSLSLGLVAAREWPTAHFRVYDDGHSSLQFKNIQVDFSNNYQIPGIEKELKSIGIDNPTNLQKEMYSRDFTVNAMLQPIDLKKNIIDVTGRGLDDVEKRILRTPIQAKLTIGYDQRRILRALKLAMKFDLQIAASLKDAIIRYRGGMKDIPMNQIKKQVNEMLGMDSKKAIDLLTEFKLLPILPLSKLMIKEITKNHMVQHLLEE